MIEKCRLVSCSEGADPSCSASTLSNEEYASLLEAAMRYPDKQVKLLMCFFHDVVQGTQCRHLYSEYCYALGWCLLVQVVQSCAGGSLCGRHGQYWHDSRIPLR